MTTEREKALLDENDQLRAEVDYVKALHKPYCDLGCTDSTCPIMACSCGWDEYPCPTIRALDGES